MRIHALIAACSLGLLSAICRADAGRFAVIVHAAGLGEAAEAWCDYRRGQGWDVALVPTTRDSTAEAIRTRIRQLVSERPVDAEARREPITAVLLLGDVGTDRIPTFYFTQSDPALKFGGDERFASDHPYALLRDDDERATIAVGRIPVTTNDDAKQLLAKVQRYEREAPTGAWRHRINYVAGEGHFGGFDALIETLFVAFIDECIPDAFDMSMTYAKPDSPWCPPPSNLERTALDRMSEGAILFNYIGHGHPEGVDTLRWGSPPGSKRTPIFRAESLADLPDCGGRNPIALMSCCSTGWFDLDPDLKRPRDCIGETMLKNSQGPIAVIAGTRPTHPYGNAVFQKEFTRELVAHADLPLGEIDRRARSEMLSLDAMDRQLDIVVRPVAALTKWNSSLEELRLMHVRMYALLGDPMLWVAFPGTTMESLRMTNGSLEAHVPGMNSGHVDVVIETPRAQSAATKDMPRAAVGEDLEVRATQNYPRANERVVWRGTAEVRDGDFSLTLPAPLPDRSRLIRAYAVGVTADGTAMESIGGLRLKPIEPAASDAHATRR